VEGAGFLVADSLPSGSVSSVGKLVIGVAVAVS